ncbi:MAG: TonB-dependent receptor [Porticoccaceae bacterium]|nr:TonB-dependent receptor [Porticoccaceae bacterium]
MNKMIRSSLILSIAASSTGYAQNQEVQVEDVLVFGRSLEQIGNAEAASEGTVGGADLAVRPLLKVAELLEAVPGMVAAQHSGSGKANQYFMRGFNLDHGTDFTTYIDDVPFNLRSHGHGHGYLDVNGLIPETVDRIDYRKGTYRADSGDFSMAGSAFMSTIDHLDESFIALETGDYDWRRIAGGTTINLGSGELTTIAEAKSYNGPWALEEDLDHKAIWSKYIQETNFGTLSASISGYSATWAPTEQIPEDAIGTADCEDEFCSLDPSAVGETDRWIGTLQVQGDDWRGTLYAQYYDWEMSSDATYDLDPQINQFDERTIFGGRYEKGYEIQEQLSATSGVEFRYDDISEVGVSNFDDNGNFVSENGRNAIEEASFSAYSELNYQASDRLRFLGGLRADYYSFDVSDLNGISEEGSESDSIISPKLGVAYRISDEVESYANWGRGFHSNDARGVVNDTDPVEGLVKGEGYEMGVRYESQEVKLTATLWWLNLDSELSFVGDSNSVEPKGGSERDGFELVAFWSPVEWLAVDAVYAQSDARFTDPDVPSEIYVDGAVESAGQLGITAHLENWELSSRLRFLGEYALVPDNSIRTGSTTSLNLRAAREFNNFTLYGELINATDEDNKDIVYYYETNVNGNDYEGRVSRAGHPRTVRLGVKFEF